jgi:hypothetical protein
VRVSRFCSTAICSVRTRIGSSMWALALLVVAATPAHAAFTGYYAIENFTLTNSNGDGFATFNAGSLVLTGGNNGSGLPGVTDFLITAPTAGTVSFNYLYDSTDDPGHDAALYRIVGLQPEFLANDFATGSVSFQIFANEMFGFRVVTDDNTFDPGVLTISNFSAPTAVTSGNVPEPGTFSLLTVAAAAFTGWRLRVARNSECDKNRRRRIPA